MARHRELAGRMLWTHALHALARCALRLQTPRDARKTVLRVGQLLPPLNEAQLRRVARKLDPAGTCLSRALTLAARMKGSEVVIGVDPRRPTATPLFAHAWVEIDGRPLRLDDRQGVEVVRL